MASPASSDRPTTPAEPAPPVWLFLNGQPLRFEAQGNPEPENRHANAGEQGNTFTWQPGTPAHIELREDDDVIPETNGRWRWTPRGFSGLYTLHATDVDTRTRYRARVRVFPSLVSYQHYQIMLNEIQQIAYHLIFQTESPATEMLGFAKDQPAFTVGLVEYAKLSKLLRHMDEIMAAIRRNPHQALAERHERVPVGYAGSVLSDGLGEGEFDLHAGRPVPRTATAAQAQPSHDTYENRLLRQFVTELVPVKLRQIVKQLDNEIGLRERDLRTAQDRITTASDEDKRRGWHLTAARERERIGLLQTIRSDCGKLQTLAQGWAAAPFLQGVGKLGVAPQPTQVLTKEPNYRRFYQVYLLFERDLRLADFEHYFAALCVRLLSKLYEIWSVFTVTALLRKVLLAHGFSQRTPEKFYKIKGDTFQIEVEANAAIEFVKGDVRVRASYERDYQSFRDPRRPADNFGLSAPRGNKTPDLAIEILKSRNAQFILMFDAKYKQQDGRALAKDVEDIYDKYVNRIAYRPSPSERYADVSSAAFVVFPGRVLEYAAGDAMGAFPLMPGGPAEQFTALTHVLEEILGDVGAITVATVTATATTKP